MRDKRILPFLITYLTLCAAQDLPITHGAKEQGEILTAPSYTGGDIILLTDHNGDRLPPLTTFETSTRAVVQSSSPISAPRRLTTTEPVPDYKAATELALDHNMLGERVHLYGVYSDDDMKALQSLVDQARSTYNTNGARCQAPYRTSKYLPGADVTGYLESRILVCENGYSLRLGNHKLGANGGELCWWAGVRFSEILQSGIKEGKAQQVTNHSLEDKKYRLIASIYQSGATWDLRFGSEKKGCPPKNGKDEDKAEYVKVYSKEEWSKYVDENPSPFDLRDLEDLVTPPQRLQRPSNEETSPPPSPVAQGANSPTPVQASGDLVPQSIARV